MKNVQFELMKPGEIIEEKKLLPLVFLPVGPLEWHGPHLPLGTDPLIAYEISLRIARDIGGVVLPPFYWGTERERDANTLKSLGFQGNEWVVGMDFPNNSMKSLYIQEDFFALGIRIILEKLVEQGYLFIVIIAVIISAPLSNSYEAVYKNPLMAESFSGFFGQNWIFLHLPVWIAVIGIFAGILMFINVARNQ